jgi:polyhydroxyalkanoate synthesis regulator protein
MVLGGEHFVVRDAKTGDDLTRSILLQIILEEESGGVPMFTTQMLGQIIRFYGHTMQGIDMQSRLAEQSPALGGASFSPEVWSQFMNVQAPMMQGLMTSYLDQSKNLFVQMQEQMHKQTENLFPGTLVTPKR